MEADADYFGQRAAEEKLAAERAAHPTARQAHLELAQRYEDLATAIVARERSLGLTLEA